MKAEEEARKWLGSKDSLSSHRTSTNMVIDLINKISSQNEAIDRLEKGLNSIKRHLEIAGGSAVHFSSVYMITCKALKCKVD